MLKAVIFDFDGVITDSEALHLRAYNEVLADFGITVSVEDYYKTYLGLSDIDCFKTIISEHKAAFKKTSVKKLLQQKKTVFERLAGTKAKIIDGVREFLDMLRENQIRLAIFSGALLAEIKLILDSAGLTEFFEVIVSAEQVKRGKPFPDGFVLALEKLNEKSTGKITANECIVIEDSHWGLDAANAAGMHTVAVTNSYDAKQLSMAEKIVTKLDELTIADLQKLCE